MPRTDDASCVKIDNKSGGDKKCIALDNSKDSPVYTIDDIVNKLGFGTFQVRLLLLAGLGWLADAFEIFILSIIGDFIACDWVLYRWQNALLSSVVFAGIMVGSPILGAIADIYGRKKCLAASSTLLFVFGSLSSVSPSFVWMAAFRASLGIALGGLAQGITLYCEFCPTNMRGKTVFYMCYLWSLGSFGVILLAWLVMEYTNNWRLLLALASVPSFVVLLTLKWYPESARYHLVSGEYEKAIATVAKLAKTNSRELPRGRLAAASTETRGRFTDLLSREHRRTSLLLWLIWFTVAFSYYGVIFISPIIVKKGGLFESANETLNDTSAGSDMNNQLPCVLFTHQDYLSMLLTSAAEFPGILVFTFLIERIDRKKLLSFSCLASGVSCMLLLLKTQKIVILIFLFVARALLVAIFQLSYLMTSEVYPTTVRAIGMGTGTAFCRLGGLIVPYVAQVVLSSSPVTAICLLGGSIFTAGIASICLPLETRGQRMKDSSESTK